MEKEPNKVRKSLSTVGRFILHLGRQVDHEPGLLASDHYHKEHFEYKPAKIGWDDQGRYVNETGEYID